jgi:hypothetical protein
MELLSSLFKDFGEIFNPQTQATDAFDTPLHVIEAMWQVKWGNEWIFAEEFNNDTFWAAVLLRLSSNELVESHRIVTAPDGNSALVYRIKSHANS